MTRRFDDLADAVLAGTPASTDDALDVLRATDEELLAVAVRDALVQVPDAADVVGLAYAV